MIPALIVGLLALGMLAWALAPLRRGVSRDMNPKSEKTEEATARKDAALDALIDIEGERAVGKLSDADFEELRWEYEHEALDALRTLDSLESDHADNALEAEIAAVKERLGGRARTMICPECGGPRTRGRPCAGCGSTT